MWLTLALEKWQRFASTYEPSILGLEPKPIVVLFLYHMLVVLLYLVDIFFVWIAYLHFLASFSHLAYLNLESYILFTNKLYTEVLE